MTNRLAGASSPYLRLHANNPVDWYPWGEEAFARARAIDRPIFLSIGYFTCHWCHVMERESFTDPATAELLNRDFVSIKVDREERPDVDRLYMTFVQATTGGGGWPLSAWLTPELRPFYGGTYFPAQPRFGMPSFSQVLAGLAQAWREQRAQLVDSAANVSGLLAEAAAPKGEAAEATGADLSALRQAVWPRLWQELRAGYDREHGGFGAAPKFPRTSVHAFLLRYARHAPAPEGDDARAMVVATLRSILAGGMHDHLGGGFHRYATDAAWRVPHFEKMLYDQAQLVTSLLEAWQATGAEDLAAAARLTCDFVLREMAAPGGGFYSAQDADSPIPEAHRVPGGPAEGEGAYYLWTKSEIDALLGDDAPAFCRHFGVLESGNVPRALDPHAEFEGRNILFLAEPIPPHESAAMDAARARLYAARRRRPHPPTDDKVLTAWNALMISALAQAGAALDEPAFAAAARAAAEFLRQDRWRAGERTLLRTVGVEAFAEDYACLIQALLDLQQADFDPQWLAWARELQVRMDELFAGPNGNYFSTTADAGLWLRLREDYDGAEPAANSVAVVNLLRLDAWFPGDDWRARAARLLAGYGERLRGAPLALPLMAAVLEPAAAPERRVTIAGRVEDAATRALLRAARRTFLPGITLVLEPAVGPAHAVVCEGLRCQSPIRDPAELEKALRL
jgi:uncharacterized protein YyaL (SSP411 family)